MNFYCPPLDSSCGCTAAPVQMPAPMPAPMATPCGCGCTARPAQMVTPAQMATPANSREACLCNMSLAMSYVLMQGWSETYEPAIALQKGTIFPDLDLPFFAGRAR